jgi:hypothetical protein
MKRRAFLKIMGIIASLGAMPASLWAFFMDKLYVRTVEKDEFIF